MSSFISLFHFLKDKYDIDVFAISHDGLSDIPFKSNLLPRNNLIHAYRCIFSKSKGLNRLYVLIVKILKKLLVLFSISDCFIYKPTLKRLSNKYDIVIGFQEGISTKFVSEIVAKKKIAWVHCDYSRHLNSGTELGVYCRFTNVVCVSKYTADIFSSIYPSLRERVKYVYNLLSYDQIVAKGIEKIDDSRFKNEKFTIISVGRLDPVKRFEYIPKIASKLKANGLDFTWYVIGPNIGNECVLDLQNNIENYNVDDYVYYLGGKENPYPYFKNSNLLVSLSQSEACPMIFNEAKILGLPVVSTDFPSSYEFIKNGLNGKICSIDDISDVLSYVISQESYYQSLLKNVAKEVYSNTKILEELDDLFL